MKYQNRKTGEKATLPGPEMTPNLELSVLHLESVVKKLTARILKIEKKDG